MPYPLEDVTLNSQSFITLNKFSFKNVWLLKLEKNYRFGWDESNSKISGKAEKMCQLIGIPFHCCKVFEAFINFSTRKRQNDKNGRKLQDNFKISRDDLAEIYLTT